MFLNRFTELNNEARIFRDNLRKDNATRRQDIAVINRKLQDLVYIKTRKEQLQVEYGLSKSESTNAELIKELSISIDNKISECDETLKLRLQQLSSNTELDIDFKNIRDCTDHTINLETKLSNMTEKFDFKTASSLLLKLDGKVESVHQLIQGIELYEPTLMPTAKPLLINYVLKACIPHNEKIRLSDTYQNVSDLISDLRKYFLPKQSAPALLMQLQNCRQNGKPLDQYGQNIADLMAKLTLAQAGDKQENINVFRGENEKVAIDVFARGIQNAELRTIIKARNYTTLNEAINAAKEESIQSLPEPSVFHFNHRRGNAGRNQFSQGSRNHIRSVKHQNLQYRGRPNFTRTYHNSNLHTQNSNYRGRGRSSNQQNFPVTQNSNYYQNTFAQRNRIRRQDGVYTINAVDGQQPSSSNTVQERRFFRAHTE